MTPQGPQRKRTRLDYDERRRLILAAARRLFCTRPYSEVSMADLARTAGVTRGLLHHYFGSKRGLYLEVVREVSRLPTPSVPEGADQTAATWEASIDAWLAAIEANRELWFVATGAGGEQDPEVEAILDEAREVLAERVLQALRLDSDPVPPVLRALVRGYGGFVQEIIGEWLQRRRLSRAQARAALVVTMPVLVHHVLPALPDDVPDHARPSE